MDTIKFSCLRLIGRIHNFTKQTLRINLCLLAMLILGFNSLYSSAKSDTFTRYTNHYFVETGSYKGSGIQAALEAGFEEVYSIEFVKKYFDICSARFKDFYNVNIVRGDSSKILWDVIKDLDQPITFWLDGHVPEGGGTDKFSPVMEELEQIKNHPIKNHIILIDDVRDMGGWAFDNTTLQQIIRKIREINPDYTFTFEDGHTKDDILVAYIPY